MIRIVFSVRCFCFVLLLAAVLQPAISTLADGRQTGSEKEESTTSTQEMAATLARLFQEQDWKTDPSKPTQRAEYYRSVLRRTLDAPTRIVIREALATELLNAGDSLGAVTELEGVRQNLTEAGPQTPPGTIKTLHAQLGLAYLRLGEQENCLAHHATRSCIFPIDANGMHHAPRGARGAVREYTALLREDPKDTSARWLLNLAYMQLGTYPDEVPHDYLIPAGLFQSEYPLPAFDDVAPQAGLAVMGHAGGVTMEDFDGDGLLDLAISSSGPTDQLRLFHNNGDGTFADVTKAAGLTGETGGLNLICGDYNNDGNPDLLVLRGGWWAKHGAYPFSLLRNQGNGIFTDVTRAAGLYSPHPTQTAAFLDFDGDGWLDIFVPHESTPGDPHPSQLFHNNHDGTFTDIAAASGLSDLGFVKAVAVGDYNNDGRPDLYLSIKGASNRLFRNDGPYPGEARDHPTRWRFADVTNAAHVSEPKESFTTWFFDYDNDGWPDLFVSGYSSTPQDVGAFEAGLPNHAELPRLYHNNHDGTFSDVTHATHLDRAILVMGANFGDLDNDGFLDVYLGTGDSLYTSLLPNRMFRNRDGKQLQDVTTAGGFGHLQKGHGVAFGDIDNDGDEDIFEEMGGAYPGDSYQSVLYRNPGTPGMHSITLTLKGVRANRSAIGAVVHVTLDQTGKNGKTTPQIFRTVGFGSSFGGNPLRQHIGLGTNNGPVSVEIHWPGSGSVDRYSGLAADHAYILTEGSSKAEGVHYKQFQLPNPVLPSSMTQATGP